MNRVCGVNDGCVDVCVCVCVCVWGGVYLCGLICGSGKSLCVHRIVFSFIFQCLFLFRLLI